MQHFEEYSLSSESIPVHTDQGIESKPEHAPNEPHLKRPNELVEQALRVKQYLRRVFIYGEKNLIPNVTASEESDMRGLRQILDDIYLDEYRIPYVLARLEKLRAHNPRLEKSYAKVLSEVRKEEEKTIHAKLDAATQVIIRNPEREKELGNITVSLGEKLTPEQKHILQENFPSGNFLLHTTDIEKMLLIIESGELLSSLEVAKRQRKEWGRGGGRGYSI